MRYIGVDLGKTAFTACFLEDDGEHHRLVRLPMARQFAVIATSTKKTGREDARTLARFLKLSCLPAATVSDPTIRELRQLFTTRDTLVQMTTQLRNMGHAALVRNGIGRGCGAFAKPESRRRLARLEGLPPSHRLVLELVLRQIEQLEAEIVEVEREIIRRDGSCAASSASYRSVA